MRRAALLGALLLAIAPAHGGAQSVPRVVLGWGVDTLSAAWSEQAWHAEARAVLRLWQAYLTSGPERQEPTRHWSSAEQRRWRVYDHTAGAAYKGFGATVLDVRPLDPDTADVFVIRTLFASATGDARDVRPLALTRVHAMRENGRWVLSSALPRHTREWMTTSIGSFTFLTPPARPLDRARAERTVAFADSLADAMQVERLRDVTYVVARSPEELHRLMGIEWTFGGLGHGYALPGLLLSGDARFGEENRHEIVHMVLQPIVQEGRTHGFINEGIATWYGGSVGCTYHELVSEYAGYLSAHPDVTLDAVIEGEGPDRGWRPAGAVLVDMVVERRGTAALRELLRTGRSTEEMKQNVAALLGLTWSEVGAAWRERVRAAAERRQ